MNRNAAGSTGTYRFTHKYAFLLFLVMFVYGVTSQAIGTLITQIIAHYSIRMAQAGLLSSFSSAGRFVAIFLIAVSVGRINKLILMGASLLLYSASLFLVSAAPPFSIMLVSFSLIGVFGATTDTLTNSLIADLMPDNLSLSMSLMHGIFGLGGLCGPIIIERLAGRLSWSQVYFAASAAFFIYLLIYAAVVRLQWRLLSIQTFKKQERFGLADILKFFTKKRHILLWFTMFFYGGNQSTMSVWVKRCVETQFSAGVWGAYALSAMWLGTAISRLVISPNIRASSLRKICVGNAVSALALAAGLLSNSAGGIAAASLVVGMSSGLTIPLILALGCEWHKDRTAFGALMPGTASSIGYMVFPPLSGLVSDFLGMSWGVAVSAASALCATLLSGILNASLKTSGAKLTGAISN